jgi:hypothetical protein
MEELPTATSAPTVQQARAYSDAVTAHARTCVGDRQLAAAFRSGPAASTELWQQVARTGDTTSSSAAVQMVQDKRRVLLSVLAALEHDGGSGAEGERARAAGLAQWMRATRALGEAMHATFVCQCEQMAGAWQRATRALERAKGEGDVAAANEAVEAAVRHSPFCTVDAETKRRLQFTSQNALAMRSSSEQSARVDATMRRVCELETGGVLLHDMRSDSTSDAIVAALSVVSQPPDNVGGALENHTVELFELIAMNLALRYWCARFWTGLSFDHRRAPNSRSLDECAMVSLESLTAIRWFSVHQKLVAKACVVGGGHGKRYKARRKEASLPDPPTAVPDSAGRYGSQHGVNRGHIDIGRIRSPGPGGVAPSRAIAKRSARRGGRVPTARAAGAAGAAGAGGARPSPLSASPDPPSDSVSPGDALDAGLGVPTIQSRQAQSVLEALVAARGEARSETTPPCAVDALLTLRVERGQRERALDALVDAHAQLYDEVLRLERVRLVSRSHAAVWASHATLQDGRQRKRVERLRRAERKLERCRARELEMQRETQRAHEWWSRIVAEAAAPLGGKHSTAQRRPGLLLEVASQVAGPSVAQLSSEVGKRQRAVSRGEEKRRQATVAGTREQEKSDSTALSGVLEDLLLFRPDVETARRAYGLLDTRRTPPPTFVGVHAPAPLLPELRRAEDGDEGVWTACFGADGQSGAYGAPETGARAERLLAPLLDQLRHLASALERVRGGEDVARVPAFIVASAEPASRLDEKGAEEVEGAEEREAQRCWALAERSVDLQTTAAVGVRRADRRLERLEQEMVAAVERTWSRAAQQRDGDSLTKQFSFPIRVLAVQLGMNVSIVDVESKPTGPTQNTVVTMRSHDDWSAREGDGQAAQRRWSALLVVSAMAVHEEDSSGAKWSANTFSTCGGSPVLLHDDGTWSKNGECFTRFELYLKNMLAHLHALFGREPGVTIEDIAMSANERTVALRLAACARWVGHDMLRDVVPTASTRRWLPSRPPTPAPPPSRSLSIPASVRRLTANRVAVVPMRTSPTTVVMVFTPEAAAAEAAGWTAG